MPKLTKFLLNVSLGLALVGCHVQGGVVKVDPEAPSLEAISSSGVLALDQMVGNDSTPAGQISGVRDGANVLMFADAGCSGMFMNFTTSSPLHRVNLSTLIEGNHQFYYIVVEPGRRPSACTIGPSYQLDLTPPAVPTALSLLAPATSPATDSTPTINVAGVEAGVNVHLYQDSACTVLLGSSAAAGSSVDITTSALLEGSHTLFAAAEDSVGNRSACSTASVTYVYDQTAPAAASSLALQSPASSPGNDSTPTVRISGTSSGDTARLYLDSACSGASVGQGVALGSTVDVTSSALSDGIHTFYAVITDSAANASACSVANVAYVLDTQAPAAPSSLALQSPASSPSNQPSPTIRVSGVTTGETVRVFTDSSCLVQIGSAVSAGMFVDVAVGPLMDGSYTLYATTSDVAGNSSACSTANVAYSLDTVAPSAPSGLSLFDPASSPGSDSTPTIRVSGVASGEFVRVYSDSNCLTEVGSATSSGTSVDVTTSALGAGAYAFFANTRDVAGNVSLCSTNSVAYTYASCNPLLTHLEFRDSQAANSAQITSVNLATSLDSSTLYLMNINECGDVVNPASATSYALSSSTFAKVNSSSGQSVSISITRFPETVPQNIELIANVGATELRIPVAINYHLPIVPNLLRYYRASEHSALANGAAVTTLTNYSTYSTYNAIQQSPNLAGYEPRFDSATLSIPLIRMCGLTAAAGGNCGASTSGATRLRVANNFDSWVGTEMTIFVVVARAANAQQWLLSSNQTGNLGGWAFGWQSSTNFRFSLHGISSGTNTVNVAVPAYTGPPALELWTGRLNAGSHTSWPGMTVFRNGTLMGTTNSGTTTLPGGTIIPHIMAHRNENANGIILLGDFILFWRPLSSAEMCAVHNALAAKYSLTINNLCP